MKIKTTVLTIEDDPRIRRLIVSSLEEQNYKVLEASTGAEGVQLVLSNNPDIIVLDLGLPDVDGADLVAVIREKTKVPIIIVSARDDSRDKVRALDQGADDYLTKPFSVDEFLARIRVSERRRLLTSEFSKQIVNGNLRVDLEARTAYVGDDELKLTPYEYKLLAFLSQNPDRVLTYNAILQEVWGSPYEGLDGLRVFMTTLRKKIEKLDAEHTYIQTHIGVGYRMLKQN